jgi:hypothetical protein
MKFIFHNLHVKFDLADFNLDILQHQVFRALNYLNKGNNKITELRYKQTKSVNNRKTVKTVIQ